MFRTIAEAEGEVWIPVKLAPIICYWCSKAVLMLWFLNVTSLNVHVYGVEHLNNNCLVSFCNLKQRIGQIDVAAVFQLG